jgi:RNA polymerase sigma factor (sigma-70 family)
MTIAMNTARSNYQASKRGVQIESNGDVVEGAFRNATNGLAMPENSAISAEDADEMMTMLKDAGLSERWRQIMLMRKGLEMPYQEIADRLNIPLGTVLSGAHRATKKLQAYVASMQ